MSRMGKVENRCFSFPCPSATEILKNRLVKLVSGELTYCDGDDVDCIGVTTKTVFATDADRYCPVDLLSAEGNLIVTAAAAFAQGAELYQAADGKVDDSGTIKRGIALEAATAASDSIAMLPQTDVAPA